MYLIMVDTSYTNGAVKICALPGCEDPVPAGARSDRRTCENPAHARKLHRLEHKQPVVVTGTVRVIATFTPDGECSVSGLDLQKIVEALDPVAGRRRR